MEARVSRLEDQFGRIEALLVGVDTRLITMDDRVRQVEIDVAETKGRVANLPTIMQTLVAFLTCLSIFTAAIVAALKLGGH